MGVRIEVVPAPGLEVSALAVDVNVGGTVSVIGGGGGGGGAVDSVNGQTGVVVLDATDVGADPAGTAASAVSTHTSDTTGVHGIADTAALVLTSDSRLSDARTPSGPAGGVLAGTYPSPSFAVDMATQAELDAIREPGYSRFFLLGGM